MNYEYLSLESAEALHKSKKAQADNKKLKTDNELYKHLYEIELKRNKELQEENERLNKEHKAIKNYVHNHTITYIDNGIECCKPDEYFNISWVENMLCGNFENLETLFEGEDKE